MSRLKCYYRYFYIAHFVARCLWQKVDFVLAAFVCVWGGGGRIQWIFYQGPGPLQAYVLASAHLGKGGVGDEMVVVSPFSSIPYPRGGTVL